MMTSRHRPEPPPGKTVRYVSNMFPDPTTSEFCLHQDVRYGMTPSLMQRDARIRISCSGIGESDVVAFFEPAYHGHYGRSEDLVDVLERAALEIIQFGTDAYEIRDAGEGPLAITPIMSGTWHVAGNTLTQDVPSRDEIEGSPFRVVLTEGEFCVLKSSEISPNEADRMRRQLRELDFSGSGAMRGLDLRVDISKAQAASDVAILRATAPIGWLPRPRPKSMIDHYIAFRTLRFRKFLATLRNDILAGLNDALHTVGGRRNFEASLSISGLRSADEFQAAIDSLLAGTVGPSVIGDFW